MMRWSIKNSPIEKLSKVFKVKTLDLLVGKQGGNLAFLSR